MQYGGAIYILINHHNTILYLGVASDLYARVLQHKRKEYPESFTAKYNCNKLVYYESFSRIEEAIDKEKVMKKWKRQWKPNLIHQYNPEWKDLFDYILNDVEQYVESRFRTKPLQIPKHSECASAAFAE